MSRNGQYVVLEGPNGAGKSTLIFSLIPALHALYPGTQILATREPGGNKISDGIRAIVQGTVFDSEMSPRCEALLYAASRAQSMQEIILPIIAEGGIVVSDRSFVSSLAFQGTARAIGIEEILHINLFAVDHILPHLVIYLDLPAEIGLERKKETRQDDDDKFEFEKLEFHKRVVAGYKQISTHPTFSNMWKTVNAAQSPEAVYQEVLNLICEHISI